MFICNNDTFAPLRNTSIKVPISPCPRILFYRQWSKHTCFIYFRWLHFGSRFVISLKWVALLQIIVNLSFCFVSLHISINNILILKKTLVSCFGFEVLTLAFFNRLRPNMASSLIILVPLFFGQPGHMPSWSTVGQANVISRNCCFWRNGILQMSLWSGVHVCS